MEIKCVGANSKDFEISSSWSATQDDLNAAPPTSASNKAFLDDATLRWCRENKIDWTVSEEVMDNPNVNPAAVVKGDIGNLLEN